MERFKPVNLRVSDAYLEQTGEEEGFVGYTYDDADPKQIKTPVTAENARLIDGKWTGPYGGTLTKGYGHTKTAKPGDKITRAEGKDLLRTDVREAESCVHRYVRVLLTQGEFDALTDLFFNVGPGRMKGSTGPNDPGKDGIYCLGRTGGGRQSTLLTILNTPDDKGSNYERAATCFTQWRQPGSVFEWGLLKRRIRFMLFFMGLPLTRAVNKFPNAPPLNDNARYDLVQRSIALAKEEKADLEFVRGPVAEPKPDPIITDKPRTHITDDLQLSPLKPEVIIAPKLPTFEEELILDQPAVSEGGPPDANGAELVRPDLPDVQAPMAEENTNIGSSKPVSPESTALDPTAPQPPRKTAPASTIPPLVIPAEKPKAPVDPDAQPEKKKDTMGTIAKDAGLDRSSVEKAITAWLIWLGNSLRSLGANGMKFFGLSGSSLSVIADQLQQPFVQIMVATAFFVCLTGGIWFVGVITEKGALKVKVKAERAEAAT